MKNICAFVLTAFAAMLTVSCASDSGTAEKSVPAETTVSASETAIQTVETTVLTTAETTVSSAASTTVSTALQTAETSAVTSKTTVTAPQLQREDLARYADPDTYAGMDFYYSERELLEMPDIPDPQTDEDYAEIAETLFQNMHRLCDYILQIHADRYDLNDTLCFGGKASPFYFMRVDDPHYQTVPDLHAFLGKVYSKRYMMNQTLQSTGLPFVIPGQNGELDQLEQGDLLTEETDCMKFRFISYRGKLYRQYDSHVMIPYYFEENARVQDMPIITDEKTADSFLAYVPYYMANSEHKKIPSFLCMTVVRESGWRIDRIETDKGTRYRELAAQSRTGS